MFVHSGKRHSPMQTLRRLPDAQYAMDNLRQPIVWPLVRPDIGAISSWECLLSAGNHRGTYHKNALCQSKRTRPPHNSTDICTRENRFHVSDTFGHEPHRCNRRTPIPLDRTCHRFRHHTAPRHRSTLSGI